jgi:hypothetical protein
MMMQPDAKKVAKWFKSKGVKPSCPACGKRKWSFGDTIAAPLYSQSGGSIPGESFPIVAQICGHCAFVRLFAAVPADLL